MIDYDEIYDFIEGWIAYAKNANTYKLRKKLLADFESKFPNEILTKEINRYLHIQKKYYPAPCTNTEKRHGIHPTNKFEGILLTIL